MSAKIINRKEKSIIVQIEIPLGTTMLASENLIQEKLNEAGSLMTGVALERFDTDGSPIVMGDVKWTSKGKVAKLYQSPYGDVTIERHVYQTSQGGRCFCPLEQQARIILTATPKFAKVVSSKYAEMGSSRVIADLDGNHGRKIARSFLQDICDTVGAVVFAKEEDWSYEVPALDKPVHSVSVGLDGTCMLIAEDGFRQAMVGTIALYDKDGERQHTIYTAATPEYGKATFLAHLENEIKKIKSIYPKAQYVGLADGAKDNWDFLNKHTETQIVDFWHVTGYLNKFADVRYRDKKQYTDKKLWLEESCHELKHKHRAAAQLLNEIESYKDKNKLTKEEKEEVHAVISYFTNNKKRMNYADAVEENLPIGSGVTEAACKVIVKQRLCAAGMKWRERGAAVVLSLRALNHSTGRWEQFWKKIDQYGVPAAA